MRINLTKKDLVNMVYMQIGFSKSISENLINEFISLIIENLIKEKKLKILLTQIMKMKLFLQWGQQMQLI